MPITKVLARKWKAEIGTQIATPVYTVINGLTTLTFSNDKEDVDTTDFTSDGRVEHMVASRSAEVSIEGFMLEDTSNKGRDPGQQAVEAAGNAIGASSLYPIRITTPGGTVKTFQASVTIGDMGGGNNDASSWGATFVVSGSITSV
jgi:hypothetical protein